MENIECESESAQRITRTIRARVCALGWRGCAQGRRIAGRPAPGRPRTGRACPKGMNAIFDEELSETLASSRSLLRAMGNDSYLEN